MCLCLCLRQAGFHGEIRAIELALVLASLVKTMLYHYNYHSLGRVDSSGIRIYSTDQLRQYDSGAIGVGVPTSEWHIIPPKQKSWMSVSYCTEKCTKVNVQPRSQGFLVFQDGG